MNYNSWTLNWDLPQRLWTRLGPVPPQSIPCCFVFQGDYQEQVKCSAEDTVLLCELGNPFRSNQEVPNVRVTEVLCTAVCHLKWVSWLLGSGVDHISTIYDQFRRQRDSDCSSTVHVGLSVSHTQPYTLTHTMCIQCVPRVFRLSEQSDLNPVFISMLVIVSLQASLSM